MSAAHDVPADLIAKYDRPGPRYTSYPTAPEWKELDATRAEQAIARLAGGDRPISVYVHVPFCERMCLFCGCNVIAQRNHDKVPGYLEAVRREIALVRALSGPKAAVQLHLGGGTPTFLTPGELTGLAEAVWAAFPPAPGAEVGLEIDPMVTTREHLVAARAVGFNRLSMGVQDFQDDVQAKVERFQPDARSTAVFHLGRELGFASINIDLMYGLPGQTPEHLRHSARRVVELGADRVAVFGYAHVPWMKPHQKKLEKHGIPTAGERWQMFNAARNVLIDAGYQAIGMDHFARPRDELAVAWHERRLNRNFQGYTVLAPTDLVAFGVTAISDVGGAFLQNVKRLSSYRAAIAEGRLAVERGHLLTDEDRLRRDLIIEIMCNLRVRFSELDRRHGVDCRAHFARELERLEVFVADGLVVRDADGFEVSERGRAFLRNIAMTFDAYLAARANDDRPRFSRTV